MPSDASEALHDYAATTNCETLAHSFSRRGDFVLTQRSSSRPGTGVAQMAPGNEHDWTYEWKAALV